MLFRSEAALLVEGFEVDRRKIQLPHPLKELGTSAVSIKLFRDITAQISVTLVKRGGDAPEDEGESSEETETSETAEQDTDTESSETTETQE